MRFSTVDPPTRNTSASPAVILDGMCQFVALLNTKGDILEVNRAALEGAGHRIEEIRGKLFWTARWWQVSEEIQEQLKAAILEKGISRHELLKDAGVVERQRFFIPSKVWRRATRARAPRCMEPRT